MQLLVGTSGFAYKEWRGSFYPERLPASRMLAAYAERLPAVEINNTFYRMPRAEQLATWAEQVPRDFVFALKASRRITHLKRLRDVDSEVSHLYRMADALGERRGPILFQLPPFLHRDLERLEGFLSVLPRDHAAVLEFRHPSWLAEDVFAALRARGVTLCLADTEHETTPCVPTGAFGYLRLRRGDYPEQALERWARTVRAQPWERAFVFFKHEGAGAGPALAERLRAIFAAREPRRVRPRRAARRASE